jgi:hypothetical protein
LWIKSTLMVCPPHHSPFVLGMMVRLCLGDPGTGQCCSVRVTDGSEVDSLVSQITRSTGNPALSEGLEDLTQVPPPQKRLTR